MLIRHVIAAASLWAVASAVAGRWHAPAGPDVRAALTTRTPPGVRPRWVRLWLEVTPGWHIGAEQNGPVGLPTRIAWQLPAGWRVAETRWPTPRREVTGGDTVFTYAGRLAIDAALDAPPAATSGPVRATVAYGLCRDVCIPGQVSVTLAP